MGRNGSPGDCGQNVDGPSDVLAGQAEAGICEQSEKSFGEEDGDDEPFLALVAAR